MSQHNLELYKLRAELCKTFSDPRRLIIIDVLRDGEKSVGELVKILEIPQAGVSRHLSILRDKGVVTTRREGTTIYYRLVDSKIGEACDLVHEILLNQLEKNSELARRIVSSSIDNQTGI